MPNTRDIRNRIKGVKNTGKITRAMQLVAASKMKRAQDKAIEGRAYADQLNRILVSLADQIREFQHPFLEEREVKRRGILILSTDRGLCGALNANLFREVAKLGEGDFSFVTIGRKARQFISRTHRNLLADFTIPEGEPFKAVRPVVEFMISQYEAGEIDTVEVLYPRFKNTLIQEPLLVPFLPLGEFQEFVDTWLAKQNLTRVEEEREFTFEPSPERILNALLDKFIKQEIYQLVLDTRASEHSARMVAMKAATDNAKKLADDLTLQYNKARQAGITQEILEITAAAQH